MGKRTEFECDNCGWEYIYENDLFAIGKNHEICLTPILFMTCGGMPDKPVNGDYAEYYCYNCNNFVKKFVITDIWDDIDGFEKEDIIKDIENYDDSIKIIKFNKTNPERFSENEVCPECGKKIKRLTDNSKCPKCHSGKLWATSIIMMD